MFLNAISTKTTILSKMFKLALNPSKTQLEPVFLEINKNEVASVHQQLIPKVIWMYWDDENIPGVVSLCYEQTKKICEGYDILLLNKKTVLEFITLPDFNPILPKAIVADYIRLKLLEKFGGIWVDASVFITEDFDWFITKLGSHQAFLFYSDECTIDIKKPISENWFIAAPKGSKFIKEWFDEFSRCITSEQPLNFYSELKKDKKLLQNLSKPDYLLCYISAIVVLEKFPFPILYASSGSVGHYFTYKHNFNSYLIATELLLCNKNDVSKPKLIKMTAGTRNVIDFFLRYKLFLSTSLLGSEMNK
ncbi:glycosyltransferase family 32 protein [Klebsiella michiganensis]|uniref:glycosyltransferase family 32 protein n=1 Tax=Klebsiella michiganensis TaxID=1134687 RepID=UPI0024483FCE|nr:capsular polysaccharide synthesis protein [Klebsiella michiganensis]MDH0490914.1 capsular polysaccharide synthesis protein [Klebsiella michiganensis]MDM4109921.1 capsular polysaccharide synthesis protein [Klebsiella michiganensis]MDM4343687.1 capsular polysaccharide synthesis protein [Klebsiella michiganensis]MDM4349157.1 capsular polysaccharide synthesis protein [Klebsiella michiganensis]HBM3063883.1 hypothetical protein [Klebsiella michiganensis]